MPCDTSLAALSHQHHNSLALCVLTDRFPKQDHGPENIARLARRVIERYNIELTNHLSIEERLLFAKRASESRVQLTEEHRDIERLVEEIQRTLPRRVLDEMGRLIKNKAVHVTYE